MLRDGEAVARRSTVGLHADDLVRGHARPHTRRRPGQHADLAVGSDRCCRSAISPSDRCRRRSRCVAGRGGGHRRSAGLGQVDVADRVFRLPRPDPWHDVVRRASGTARVDQAVRWMRGWRWCPRDRVADGIFADTVGASQPVVVRRRLVLAPMPTSPIATEHDDAMRMIGQLDIRPAADDPDDRSAVGRQPAEGRPGPVAARSAPAAAARRTDAGRRRRRSRRRSIAMFDPPRSEAPPCCTSVPTSRSSPWCAIASWCSPRTPHARGGRTPHHGRGDHLALLLRQRGRQMSTTTPRTPDVADRTGAAEPSVETDGRRQHQCDAPQRVRCSSGTRWAASCW